MPVFAVISTSWGISPEGRSSPGIAELCLLGVCWANAGWKSIAPRSDTTAVAPHRDTRPLQAHLNIFITCRETLHCMGLFARSFLQHDIEPLDFLIQGRQWNSKKFRSLCLVPIAALQSVRNNPPLNILNHIEEGSVRPLLKQRR